MEITIRQSLNQVIKEAYAVIIMLDGFLEGVGDEEGVVLEEDLDLLVEGLDVEEVVWGLGLLGFEDFYVGVCEEIDDFF